MLGLSNPKPFLLLFLNYLLLKKANKATNTVSCFLQRSINKKKILLPENIYIIHYLKLLLTSTSLEELKT